MKVNSNTIPSIFTIGNFLLGFLSILKILDGNFYTAAWFIILAVLCDGMDGKIARIEEMDAALPCLLAADPDVLIVTGDHSTPPSIMAHSWHPVPVLMKAPFLRGGDGPGFDEITCRSGQIGTIRACELIPLAMAHAGKLEKYGA